MRKPTRIHLPVPFSVAGLICIALTGAAQEVVQARYAEYSSVKNYSAQTGNTISLKDAIAEIRKNFRIKVAYRQGLLDDKMISQADLKKILQGDAESALTALLAGFPVSFKKIGNNQYTVFETANKSIPEPAALQDVFQPIKGRLTASGENVPVPGATITVKEFPNIVTTSDDDGNFVINLPASANGKSVTLIISSIGFGQREVVVKDGDPELSIELMKAEKQMSEVVVTALGINRQRKSLGYAVTEVKGSEFTQARENNVANALSGKIAGVNAAGLSTGPGGSSRVIIRGNGSLNGDNQPLYVVNGMPIDNSVPGGAPTVNGITNNVDRGDGIAGINPDDIESISVLKGGTAAALYGSRASNGVILITTKKGRSQKGIGIEYNSTLTMENVAVIPDFQYEYGQGSNGVKPVTLTDAQASGRRSWGAKIDGSTDYMGVDGKTHPYVAQKRNLQNYYQTGTTFTNSVAFTGGNEAVTYRFSAADLNSRGILPTTTYKRKTLNLALNAKVSNRIAIEVLGQYNLEKGHNRTGAGDALGNPNWTPLEIANTADVRWLAPGYDEKGNETIWNDAAIASNGYFVINKFREDDTKNRFIGQASVSYKLLENLVFKATISRDFYNYNYVNILPTGTLYVPQGQYAGIKSDVSETNGLVTGTYNLKLNDDIGINVMAGVNGRRFENKEVAMNGAQFTIPYFYSFSNLATSSTIPYTGRVYTNSVFGSVDFDYKNLFFLTLTGREDWFSTLSPKNNHIFYPSVGGSFILSDALQLPDMFDFAKVRGSWAQVGGGAPDPYQINLSYSNVPSSGPTLQNVTSSKITNAGLRPYTSTTYEAGIEFQLFRNRIGLDVTYYSRKTTNDIISTAISGTSGYSSVILNVGELSNRGVEVLLTGKPVKGKNFGWNVSYNVAYNDNKVVKLAPGLTSIQLAASVNSWAFLNNIEGKPFGTLVGTRIKKDDAGNVVFNSSSGLPMPTELQELGNSVAPVTMGLTNEFNYKNFSLSFLLDGKFGNKIFSIFEVYAMRLGKLKSTLPGRENGLVLNGVDENGNKYTRTVAANDLRPYYDNNKSYSELFLHDGSFVKLRQIIFSYHIPVGGLRLVKLQSASVSVVARNLLTLYRETDNFDPEQSFTNSNNQGFESIGLPRTRSLGINLTVKF